MTKIDTRNWKEFRVGDLFDIRPTKHYNDENGKALSNAKLMDPDGVNPVVVNSSYNNGIGGYTNKPCNEKGGIITFSDTTTSEAIFYQPNDFVGYSHVQGMYPKKKYSNKWSMRSMMFFMSVFRSKAKSLGYDYVNKFTRVIASDMIVLLPVDSHFDPDWDYMESYVRSLNRFVNNTLNNLLEFEPIYKKKVDISDWGEFKIGGEDGLFDVYTGGDLILYKTAPGNIPVISHSRENNGIQMFAEKIADRPLFNHTRTISLADRGNFKAFVQNEDFYIGTRVKALLLKDKYPTPKRTVLQFMAVVIDGLATKFCYKENATDSLIYQTIKLPIKDKGNIDWEYIEDYMQNITNSVNNTISFLFKGIS